MGSHISELKQGFGARMYFFRILDLEQAVVCHSFKHTVVAVCNEHGTINAISSDFGDRMTTQHLD